MYLNFVPDLFLETQELTILRESLDDNGFRKALLNNSVSFGLVKNDKDPSFGNGRVERDLDNALNQKTIKIGAITAINNEGLFITNDAVSSIPVPSDGNWYWVKINHAYSSLEAGKVQVDASGNLTGVDTEFTKILRGNPNFPSVIRFSNSVGNTLEYEVLEVIDDTHAIIVHPAITANGDADFVAEGDLSYQIVGTFTDGVAVPNANKYPFKYDSCAVQLEVEVSANVRPVYTTGQEFFLARVRVNAGNLVIQDKRTEYWESKGSSRAIAISRASNPLIGIEAAKWQNVFNVGDRNIVEVAWGMRSSNWVIDSSQNIVTLLGSSLGGSFKSTADFTDGDFNGMRLYSANGKYGNIVNSIKQGGAINLYLDVLDVDNFSTDGGVTFTGEEVFVAPDCDQVQIRFIPEAGYENVEDIFSFPVNTSIGKCLPTVYKDATCLYNVQYRYKSFKEFTKWLPINSGEYFTEVSFDEGGALKGSTDRVIYPYNADPVVAFLQLTISPDSWEKFKGKVYKGDVIGVNTITSFTAQQVLELKVGVDKRYQHVVGNISLADDVYISLSRLGAVEGNEFRLHFECDSLSLGTKVIYILDDYSGGTLNPIKTIGQGDVYHMKNQDGGIVIDCVFTDQGNWIAYQNYDLGQPFEIKMFDGSVSDYFDTSLMGKTKGYFGWQIYQIMSGRVPIGYGDIQDASGNAATFAIGNDGGELKHKLIVNELPAHSHLLGKKGTPDGPLSTDTDTLITEAGLGGNSSYALQAQTNGDGSKPPQIGSVGKTGKDVPHNNLQPYHVVAFIKKQY